MLGCKHAGHILLRTILCWKEIRTKKYFFQIVCLTRKHKQRKMYLSKNVPQAQWIRESCSDGGGGGGGGGGGMCSVMIFIEHKHSDHSFLAACNFISISAHPTSRNKIHPPPTQPRSQLRSSLSLHGLSKYSSKEDMLWANGFKSSGWVQRKVAKFKKMNGD